MTQLTVPNVPEARFCFEVSWEVCNKVGGIYTVLKTKAQSMTEHYNGGYYTIGPYFIQKAHAEFEEQAPPDELKPIADQLKEKGIICHFGKWAIPGNPNCILLDFTTFTKNKDSIKKQLWDEFQIDSLNTEYFDFDEPVIWATAVGMLVELFAQKTKAKSVAHFHEWLSGAGLLYLKMKLKSKNDADGSRNGSATVATVFTTHATVLGRALCSSGADLYSSLDGLQSINPDSECYRLGCNAKHQLEKQTAQNADAFTTVSEITSMEAEKILGRKADVILPNGLLSENFPVFEQALLKHAVFKARIKEFISYYFFPYYTFNLDKTLIAFLCGRYEFRDKGIDVFIKALGSLNKQLISEGSSNTVVAFFWVPGNIRGIKTELLDNKEQYLDIRESIDDNSADIKNRIMFNLICKRNAELKEVLSDETSKEVQRKLRAFTKKGQPPLCTHDLFNEDDEILNAFKKEGLLNSEKDRVKVIFYAIYLTGADGLLQTSYYESMLGSHLGVFPSYYEPWGYTPLECAALAVPSITTDLAGFGRYLKSQKAGDAGIFVIDRIGKKDDEITSTLAELLHDFVKLGTEQRLRHKLEAKKLAAMAEWKIFVEEYIKAHNIALDKQR